MKLTALTCMYEKPPEVVQAVLEAIDKQEPPAPLQVVVVLDRPSAATLEVVKGWFDFIRLDGPPGWRSPCLSWNAGLEHVTGETLVILQGDVVLLPGSIQHVSEAILARPAAYFGQVLESNPAICVGPGHAGPVLCNSTNPRPLTYLLAVPTQAVRAISGWDEAFQAGVWYEDDDFTIRLWKHGLDFVFDDHFQGVHQSHQRGYALPIAIAKNLAIFLERYGTERYFDRELRSGRIKVDKEPGRTTWRHRE